ncbi:MAG: FAD-dependent oxidoreductase [Bradymonadales bacterium]|jgi:NADPH-dependent 2,4-dienoyl-CoA reductase/sulfur reductase-like enzyme
MKVIIIGLNHAGCAAARTILNLGGCELSIYDRNREISFLSCGMALWIGGQLASGEGLFYAHAKDFEDLGAKVYVDRGIEFIDFDKKLVKGLQPNGEPFYEKYDKLILATGSKTRPFNVLGADLENVVGTKFYRDAEKAVRILRDPEIKNAVVVGAGYIGTELAEACRRLGKEVALIDIAPRILYTHTDEKFSHLIENRLLENGVKLQMSERVLSFEGDSKVRSVRTVKGEYPAEIVFLCTGFEPVTELGRGVLKLGNQGAFLVDRKQQTSQKDVYAIGDCATIYDNSINDNNYIALASSAIRSGIIAAHNVLGQHMTSLGSQGSSGLSIYGMRLVTTGLSVKMANDRGIDVDYVDVVDKQLPASLRRSDNPDVHLRLVYRKKDRVIVGAQMASTYDMSGGIHMYSLAIQQGLTLERLAFLDNFFMPQIVGNNYYGKAAMRACTT